MKKEFNNLFENPVGVAFGAKPIFKKNKMIEEFKLSEKRFWNEQTNVVHGRFKKNTNQNPQPRYLEKDIKEFIKKEDELIDLVFHHEISWSEFTARRNELVGEKLI